MKQTPKNPSDSLGEATWLHRLPVIAGVLALLLIVGYAFTFKALPAGESPAAWGTFGDYIGGLLNPLISLFTLMVAMQVWKLQKTELAETQRALKEQAKTSEQQRQEQRFFDLLNVYQRTVESISFTRGHSSGGDTRELLTSNGKQAISAWLTYTAYSKAALGAFDPTLLKSNLESRWQKMDAPGTFDHYFRVVFRILSEAEALLGDQHQRYAELFRAQLSRSELIILGNHLWLGNENRHNLFLAEKYCLLEHLPHGHLRIELEALRPNVFLPCQAQPPRPSPQSESPSQPC